MKIKSQKDFWSGLMFIVTGVGFTWTAVPSATAYDIRVFNGTTGALLFSALIVSLFAHTCYVMLLQKYEANLSSALTLMTPLITIGIIDPSTTRNLLIPRTRSCASTTARVPCRSPRR